MKTCLDLGVLARVQEMAEESLDPFTFEMWERVKQELFKNRGSLTELIGKDALSKVAEVAVRERTFRLEDSECGGDEVNESIYMLRREIEEIIEESRGNIARNILST